jgi:hypothetical protein
VPLNTSLCERGSGGSKLRLDPLQGQHLARPKVAGDTYHLSSIVFGLAAESAATLEELGVPLCGAAKGLEYREREARWVGSLIVSPSR